MKTTGHSRPLAAWQVEIVTLGWLWSSFESSVSAVLDSVNAAMKLRSSVGFSDVLPDQRPSLSAERTAERACPRPRSRRRR